MSGSFNELSAYIEQKLEDDNLGIEALAHKMGVSRSVLDKVLNKNLRAGDKVISRPAQISFESLLRIANHDNPPDYGNCSIDSLLGRDEFALKEEGNFKKISLEESMAALREYINRKLSETGLTIFELSKKCGFGKDTFSKFMKGGDSQAVMSTPAIIAIADLFGDSIDEKLLGRKQIVTKELGAGVTPAAPKFLEGLSKKDMEAVEIIRKAGISDRESGAKGGQTPPKTIKPSRVR